MVDSGDILIGSALSSFFRGELDIKAMNMIGYHAMAAGNHDFDFGIAHLAGLQRLADFPILCTNIMGESLRLPCRSATVLSVGGLKVGVIGLLGHGNFVNPSSPGIVAPGIRLLVKRPTIFFFCGPCHINRITCEIARIR